MTAGDKRDLSEGTEGNLADQGDAKKSKTSHTAFLEEVLGRFFLAAKKEEEEKARKKEEEENNRLRLQAKRRAEREAKLRADDDITVRNGVYTSFKTPELLSGLPVSAD